MRTKWSKFLLVITVISIALAACTSAQENNNAQIAEEPENQLADTSDAPGEGEIPAEEACTGLGNLLEQHLKLESDMISKTFGDLENGISGEGCQLTVGGNVSEVGDWGTNNKNFVESMFDAGWVMDTNFSAALESGELLTVRKSEYVCMYFSVVGPATASLCSGDEPLSDCLERLAPSNIIAEATISCTSDNYIPEEAAPEPANDAGEIRISFAEGETSANVSGKLEPASMDTYMLHAEEGQELVVSLSNSPPNQGLLVIYGEDGTVLVSDQAAAAFWNGIIPVTQDYFIDVLSSAEYALSYNMQVVLPPQGEIYTGAYNPMEMTACEELKELLSNATGIEATISNALFYDYYTQGASSGCQMTAWGTLDMFPGRNEISTAVIGALNSQGWYDVQEYSVDGPGGFGTGFFKDESLCLYFELVHELDPWVCEEHDGAIFDCWNNLTETEMYYEIQLTCATAK